jgi:integrase
MANSSNIKTGEILPEFQKFLVEKKLVPDKNVPFLHALWASRFFNYCRKRQISSDAYQENVVAEFLEALKSDPHPSDWQIRQASDAIRLYYFNYRGLKRNPLPTVKSNDPMSVLLNETRRLLRLMELASLRVKDIDFDSNTIFVRSGKGNAT